MNAATEGGAGLEMSGRPSSRHDGGVEKSTDSDLLHRFRKFTAMNELKKRALMVIAGNLPKEELKDLKEKFIAMDKDSNGSISLSELREVLKRRGSTMSESEVQMTMSLADVNGDGRLDFHEFLAATLQPEKLQEELSLYHAFQHFDKDNSGYITIDEVQAALQSMQHDDDGEVYEQILEVIALCDKDENGRIDYQEFCEMMRNAQEGLMNEEVGT